MGNIVHIVGYSAIPFPVCVCLSIAIMQYLAEKFQTPDHWYPTGLRQRARINEYLSWQHAAIRMHGTKIFWLRVSRPCPGGWGRVGHTHRTAIRPLVCEPFRGATRSFRNAAGSTVGFCMPQ